MARTYQLWTPTLAAVVDFPGPVTIARSSVAPDPISMTLRVSLPHAVVRVGDKGLLWWIDGPAIVSFPFFVTEVGPEGVIVYSNGVFDSRGVWNSLNRAVG